MVPARPLLPIAAAFLLLGAGALPALAGTVDLPSFQFRYGEGVISVGIGIACGPDSMVYVADQFAKSVVAFTSNGIPMGSWPVGATPNGIAAGPDGSVWVTTSDSGDVRGFSRDGVFLLRFGGQMDDVPGHLWSPRPIAVSPYGDVFVADDARDVIAEFTPLGEFVGEIHTSPCPFCNTGLFTSHSALAIAPDQSIYVVIPMMGEIRHYSAKVGNLPDLPPPFPDSPYGVTVDPATSEVYVAAVQSIAKYSAASDSLGTIAADPDHWGNAHALAIDHTGHLHALCVTNVARFGLSPVPTRARSWGEIKARWR